MIAAIDVSEAILQPAGRSLSAVEVLALERTIEIVSEASRHIPEALKAEFATVPWRQIAGIGNVLRHDYRRISQTIITKVAIEDFPTLKIVLTMMRTALEDGRNS